MNLTNLERPTKPLVHNCIDYKDVTFTQLFNMYPLKPVLIKNVSSIQSLKLINNIIIERNIKGTRIFCVCKNKNDFMFFNKYGNVIKNLTVPLLFNCSVDGCLFDGVLSPANIYHIFDIQYVGYEKITHKLLVERKKILKNILTNTENVNILPYEEISNLEDINKPEEWIIKSLNQSYKSGKKLWYTISDTEEKTIMTVMQIIKNDQGKYKEVVCFSEAHNRHVTCYSVPRALSKKLILSFGKKPKKATVLHDCNFTNNRLLSFIW